MTLRNFFAGAVAAGAMVLSTSSADAREMSLATYIPASISFVQKLLEPWADWINEKANGEFTVKVYAGGTLGRDPNQQDRLVSSGVADIAAIVPGRNLGAYPHYSIFELRAQRRRGQLCRMADAPRWDTEDRRKPQDSNGLDHRPLYRAHLCTG